MKRLSVLLLAACVAFAVLIGCEQEIDPLLFLSFTDMPESTVVLDEQNYGDHLIITDESSPQYGEIISYYGKAADSGLYVCECGYISPNTALRGFADASGSDLILSDELWLLPNDSVKLRSAPSQKAEVLNLIFSDDILAVRAVSYTDTMYYAVDAGGLYGYISSDSAHISRDRAELEFYSQMNSFSPVGAQLTLIDNGEIVSTYAYGMADIESGTAMTADTKIRVASLSKVLLCICTMKLREEGAVDIDKNIGRYLADEDIKNPSYPDADITLRSILTHTSSVKAQDSYLDLANLREHLYSAAAFDAEKQPGTAQAWQYNNFAVSIGGTVLELAADRTVQDYANKTIFAPMGITAAYSVPDLPLGCSIATLYRESGTPARSQADLALSVSDTPGENSLFFAGGLYISSYDYAKLLLMLMNDGVYEDVRILSEASVSEMETAYFEAENSPPFSQCLVLRKNFLYGRTLFYHTGNAYGTIAMASYDPETGDGAVIVTTGASAAVSDNGIYEICNGICEKMYTEIL